MKPKVISEKPITASELKQELARIKERDNALSTRATRTNEHLEQAVLLESAKSKQLFDKLVKLNVPRLKEQHICKIVDTMPLTINELKAVLQGYVVTVTADNIKKIAEAIKEFS